MSIFNNNNNISERQFLLHLNFLFIAFVVLFTVVNFSFYLKIIVRYRPDIDMMVRVLANGLVKSYQRLKKMVLDASWLNTLHYRVRIKSKVEQSSERSCTLPYTLAIEKGGCKSPSRLASHTRFYDRKQSQVQLMLSTDPSYDNRIQVMTTLDCHE